MARRYTTAVVGIVLAAGACTGSDDDERMQWQSSEPHFVMTGQLDGEAMDVTLMQVGTTEDLRCTREYEVPVVDGAPDYAQARYVETKLNIVLTIGGSARLAEIELKQHAMDADELGAVISIVPRVDGQLPAADEMWFEWEWHSLDDVELYESAATQGSFTLEAFDGTPSMGAIIAAGEGSVGGVLHAQWSPTEEVELSFTAPCTENDIVEVQ